MRSKWSKALSFDLRDVRGTTLHSLDDARAYLLALPARDAEAVHWRYAVKLVLEAGEGNGSIEAATRQMKLALFLSYRLDLSHPMPVLADE